MSDVKALAREACRGCNATDGVIKHNHIEVERALLKYGEMREAAATARFVDMFRDCGLDQAANALEAERASKPADTEEGE